MVTVHGNAASGNTHPGAHIPLPAPAPGPRPAHRPWCADCKTTVDAAQLDDTGRCPTCAPLAARRDQAAERRRLADLEDARTARTKPTPRPPTPAASKPRYTRVLDRHRADVIRLYTDGAPAREIAEKYDVGQPTVLAFLRAHNVPVRGRGGHPIKTGATA